MVWPPQGDDSPSFGFKAVCCCEVIGPPLDVFEYRWTAQNNAGVCMAGIAWHGVVYKTRTWSGSITSDVYDSCGGDLLGSQTEDYGGSMNIDPAGDYPGADCHGGLTYNGDFADCSGNPMPVNGCPDNYVETDTTGTYTGTGACTVVGAGFGCIASGAAVDTYSDPDTKDDAIARLMDNAGASVEDGSDNWATWEAVEAYAWYAPVGPPGDPGFSFQYCFGYQHGEWRLRRNHLLPSTMYTVSVEIWRAAWDGGTPPVDGDYSLYATQEVEASTDADGLLKTAPAVIPNDEGFVTRTKMSTVTVTPS